MSGPARDLYRLLLGMILATIVLDALLSGPWGVVIRSIANGAVLLFAMYTSHVGRGPRIAAFVLVPLLLVCSLLVARFGEDRVNALGIAIIGFLVIGTIVAIANRLRTHHTPSIATVEGVLCIYLLLGIFYAVLYSTVAAVSQHSFFVQGAHRGIDYLYFSYITLTTVGYGDLTPATDVGKMLAVSEALIGQMFLVSVVAVTVGNMSRSSDK